MISDEETIKWLKENRMNEDGDLDLQGLDLSKDFEDVYISHLKVKGFLHQHCQQVDSGLFQNFQKVKGMQYQHNQKVSGSLFQDCQTVAGDLYQDDQKVTGNLYQGNQKVIDGCVYDGMRNENG